MKSINLGYEEAGPTLEQVEFENQLDTARLRAEILFSSLGTGKIGCAKKIADTLELPIRIGNNIYTIEVGKALQVKINCMGSSQEFTCYPQRIRLKEPGTRKLVNLHNLQSVNQ